MVLYKTKTPYESVPTVTPGDPKSSDALAKLIDAAKILWCTAYANSPGLALPGAVGQLNQGVYENICAPTSPGYPPPPEPPFEGGQCDLFYRVEGSYTSRNVSGGFGCDVTQQWWTETQGPIQGVFVHPSLNIWGVQTASGASPCKSYNNLGPTNAQIQFFEGPGCQNVSNTAYGDNLVIGTITTVGGEPDNCGSLPNEYPEVSDPPPSYTDIVDIAPDGSPNNIDIPLVYVPFNTELNINPYIDVGGISIEFHIDGIEIGYDDEVNPIVDLPPFNNNPPQIIEKAPIPSDEEFPTVENCCTEVNQILAKVNTDLPAPNYDSEFLTLYQQGQGHTNKLDELLDDSVISISVPIGSCGTNPAGESEYTESTGSVSAPKSGADRAHAEQLYDNIITKLECDPAPIIADAVAGVPEAWTVRKGADVPQLVQIMRRAGTRTYHSFSIPHPADIAPREDPLINAFTGGNFRAQIRLIDNSRFICFAVSRAEAENVVGQVLPLIDSAWLDNPPEISYAEIQGLNVAEDVRLPVKNQYYSTGNKTLAPDWEEFN